MIDFDRLLCTLQPSAISDQSALEDFSVSTEPTTSSVPVGTRRKRRNASVTPTPPASPAPSTNSSCSAILNKAVAALQTSDKNTTFCDHLLSELKALPETKAFDLRRALNQTMWDFLDSIRREEAEMTTIISPIQFVDELGQNISVNKVNMKEVIVLQNETVRPIANVQQFVPIVDDLSQEY